MTVQVIEPFEVRVPDAALEDLRERLARTRWPGPAPVDGWSDGVPLGWLHDLVEFWADGYDWRACERRLGAWTQYRVTVDGLAVHVLHARSPHPGALPLLLTNGWPSSVTEYLDVLGPLTDPPAHGGDGADAFDVVIPALPGYGFSDPPTAPGWGVDRIARAWAAIMSALGYSRFGAHGTDWGTSVLARLAQHVPDAVVGLHLSPPLAGPDPATLDDLTAAERAALADLERVAADGDGYTAIQATRPQTIGYGLVDSPVGLAAWLAEKLVAWTDDRLGPPGPGALTRTQLLDDITLYWLTGTAASSARLYKESIREVQALFTGAAGEGDAGLDTVGVPVGATVYPREVPRPSRRWAERRYTDLRMWNEPEYGGHFPAMEQPELFVSELRRFFRLVR